MTVHEQFADDLALHGLGTLQGVELMTLENHLRECASCRRELEQLRGDMALLALSTAGPKPPQRSRERLLLAIAKEPRRAQVAVHKIWWTPMRWAAAGVLALVTILLWRENHGLRQYVAALQTNSQKQQQQLQQAKDVLGTLTASNASRFTLVAAKAPPQPQGKAIYVRDCSRLIFMANNMPALPPHKAYELWLIPMSGAPIPAGMFRPDAHGSAMVMNPPLPQGVEAKTFAVTIEPEGGSSAPSTQPLMVGVGG
jgi:anti-sigma-K factor RskA